MHAQCTNSEREESEEDQEGIELIRSFSTKFHRLYKNNVIFIITLLLSVIFNRLLIIFCLSNDL